MQASLTPSGPGSLVDKRVAGSILVPCAACVACDAGHGRPWISVPKVEKLPEPPNLGALQAEVEKRWGTIDLLDVLKEVALCRVRRMRVNRDNPHRAVAA